MADLYLYFLCAVDGNYTEWTDWTVCDKTCGTGLMTRWRACSNPTPQYGGRDCSLFGPDMETKTCVMKDYCPSKFNAYFFFVCVDVASFICKLKRRLS